MKILTLFKVLSALFFLALQPNVGAATMANPTEHKAAWIADVPPDPYYKLNPTLLENIREPLDDVRYGKRSPSDASLKKLLASQIKANDNRLSGSIDEILANASKPLEFVLTQILWRDRMARDGSGAAKSFATLAIQQGLVVFQHLTSVKNLVKIIKYGGLSAKRRGESSFGGTVQREEAAYLTGRTLTSRQEWIRDLIEGEDDDGAIIEYHPDILDLTDWSHATPRPAHGHQLEDSASRDRSFELYAILSAQQKPGTYNEVVSYKDIPFRPGTEWRLLVRGKHRAKILAALQSSKLVLPKSLKSWNEAIEVIE